MVRRGVGRDEEAPAKVKPLRRDIPMAERGRKKRDGERERAFLAHTGFPSWKSPLGANRAIQAKPADHRLRIYLSALLSPSHPPLSLFLSLSIALRRVLRRDRASEPFFPSPRHITLHLQPILRRLSIRVGFRVTSNLSILGAPTLS